MNFEFTKNLKIRFSETDNRGEMKPVSIFDCFQDIGCEHAAMMGLATTDLLTKNYTWIMLRYNVDIHRAPFWNEDVVIRSWRHPHKNLYELRKFEIIDESGKSIIEGVSSWVMMDYTSRKPVRLSRFMGEDLLDSEKTVEDDFFKLPGVKAHSTERIFNVRIQDIDYNNHVNNSVYVGWAIETVPSSVYEDFKLVHVDVSYLGEISYGNRIYSRLEQVENSNRQVFFHSVYGGDDIKELTRLRTVWEKRL